LRFELELELGLGTVLEAVKSVSETSLVCGKLSELAVVMADEDLELVEKLLSSLSLAHSLESLEKEVMAFARITFGV
jgi:hypothetical protein